ncbi:MAG TPA: MMPL family transporter [Thermodesulfobacteriota bacterium]|nr:MMPL family transporter [Thermodesulfobacteriota bacterium]
MFKQTRTCRTPLLERWTGFIGHHPILVLLFSFLTTVAVLTFTVSHFRIDTDMNDMISERLPYRKLEKEFDRAFPQLGNTILVVLDGQTPEAVRLETENMAIRLREETRSFKKVYTPGSGKFFEENGLLYLSVKELEDLSDSLAGAQPLLGLISKDFSLRGLFSVAEKIVGQKEDGEQKEKLTPFFDRLARAIEGAVSNRRYEFSWHDLMMGKEARSDMRRKFIIVEPASKDDQFPEQETAIEAVYRIRNELAPQRTDRVTVRVTGDIALNHENLLTVRKGMGMTTLISFLLVSVALVIGVGSGRLFLASLLTLLVGLICTFGFAIAVIGYLNLISVTFTVLFIGIGIDYGIQFCLRYREEMASGLEHHDALIQTAKGLGVSLRLCTVAAALGFYSFLPTAYVGVSELGLIAGTGMFINLFATLTVLPALLTLMPLTRDHLKEFTGGRTFYLLPYRYGRTIRIAAIITGIGAILFIPGLSFDYNPLNLYNPDSEAVSTIRELFEDERISPWTLSILLKNEKEALECADRLKGLKEVKGAITLADFVPKDQSRKLAVISDIALFMPPELGNLKPEKASYEEELASSRGFGRALKNSLVQNPEDGGEYGASIKRLSLAMEGFTKSLDDPEVGKQTLERLEKSLLSSLPVFFRDLTALLRARKVTESDLPQELQSQYVSPGGIYRVEVIPSGNLMDTNTLKRFVNAVTAAAPSAIGTPLTIREAGKAVFHSFLQAVVYALIAITIYLLIELKSLSDTVLILLPITLSLILTGAASVILGIPFNFANVIVIPLLIGSGVEGTYMIHRFRKEPPSDSSILKTSTARALFFSAATTILSFSTLSFSSHRGMATMGKLLTVCIGSLLITTLILLPALLSTKNPRKNPGA